MPATSPNILSLIFPRNDHPLVEHAYSSSTGHGSSSIPTYSSADPKNSWIKQERGPDFVPFQSFSNANILTLQIVLATFSSLSIISVWVAFYWFFRMKKRFRHRLIMLLVIGDSFRSVWYLVNCVIAIKAKDNYVNNALCQASGFFIQFGNEIADLSVLIIAVHGAMQVFRTPAARSGDQGLFHWRFHAYALVAFLPIIMASIPYAKPVDSVHAYIKQGPICSLPIRPYWFRLALQWVPRYIIAIIIIGLAIAIYVHLRREFTQYAAAQSRSYSFSAAFTKELFGNGGSVPSKGPRTIPRFSISAPGDPVSPWTQDPRPLTDPGTSQASSRRHSNVTFASSQESGASSSRRLSAIDSVDTTISPDEGIPPHAKLPPPPASSYFPQDTRPSVSSTLPDVPEGITTGTDYCQSQLDSPSVHGAQSGNSTQARRKAHVRHLRHLFIYPIVYLLMWLIPFVNQCMQYSTKWAEQGPPFPILLLTCTCLGSMGTVDCIIFSIREKPWRHTKRNFFRPDLGRRSSGRRSTQQGPPWHPPPGHETLYESVRSSLRGSLTGIKKRLSTSDRGEAVAADPGASGPRKDSGGERSQRSGDAITPTGSEVHRRSTAASEGMQRNHSAQGRDFPRKLTRTLSVRPMLRRGQSDYCVGEAEQAYKRLAVERRDRKALSVDEAGTGTESIKEEEKTWWSGYDVGQGAGSSSSSPSAGE